MFVCVSHVFLIYWILPHFVGDFPPEESLLTGVMLEMWQCCMSCVLATMNS